MLSPILRFCAAFAAALASLVAARAVQAQACLTSQSCLTAHAPGGCNSAACCLAVCNVDPTCCSVDWDAFCISTAHQVCVGYCGANINGSCYSVHANPACNNAACCTSVCTADPYCCSNTWDVNCAQYASFLCPGTPGTCGQSGGSCFAVHSTGACSEVNCCNAVCTIDPTCCSSSWDVFCVAAANEVCVASCTPVVEANAQIEVEECTINGNDPCYTQTGGEPEQILVGRQVSGSLGRPLKSTLPLDVDVYRFSVTDPDGDGGANVSITFASSPVAWAAIVADTPCSPLNGALRNVSSQLCVDTVSPSVCLAPGSYQLVVGAGTFPALGGAEINCNAGNRYTFTVNSVANCGSICSSAQGSCFVARETPGCDVPTCCTGVCAADPFCCSQSWDSTCVARAGQSCLTGPPANDLCSNAQPAIIGSQSFNTIRALTELPQIPKQCTNASFVRDVWFSWTADHSGAVTVSTCGAWFDTVIAVYESPCATPLVVSCNNDAQLCPGVGASKVIFEPVCGVEYLFRIGQTTSTGGEANLLLSTGTALCQVCTADFDHDGSVSASDLSLLLASWGLAGGDLDGDGTTAASDLSLLLASWGACN